MATIDYCSVALGDHEQVSCADYPKGGAPVIALMEQDHSITDLTDDAQWISAIAASEVVLLKSVKGLYQAASEVTQTNPVGDGPENITVSFDHEITWTDANVTDVNDASYAAYNGRSLYLAVYNPSTGKISYFDQPALIITPPSSMPDTKREYQQYSGKATFTSDIDWYAVKYTAPASFTA
jgi:hypothetical protein